MKVAVCISGLPRSYKPGFVELKKWFLDKYDCDVYIHTWYDTKTVYETGHRFVDKAYYTFTKEDYNNILELYQPKDYCFQKPIPFDVNEIQGPELGYKLHNILSAAYSAHSCFELVKESGIEYDIIVRYRFDLYFTDMVMPECQFLTDITQLDLSKVNVFAYDKDEDGHPTRVREIDDIFAVGGYEPMEKFYSFFSYLLYYLYIDPEYPIWLFSGTTTPDKIVAESLLKYHLIKQNVEIDYIESLNPKWYTAGIIR